MADLIRIYYKARNNCLKMCETRGYTVPENLKNMTIDEFGVAYEKNYLDIYGITDQYGRTVYVKFINPSHQYTKNEHRDKAYREIVTSLQQQDIEITSTDELIENFTNERIRLIIIYNPQHGEPTTKKKEVPKPFLEVFKITDLSKELLDHVYQPKYKLITERKEIEEIYQRYNCKPNMIPSICIDDPIVRYFAARPAEKGKLANVFEITRDGRNISYRKVINKKMNIK